VKSVLGKLIQRRFGCERYTIYTEKLNKKESMDIFCDIYRNLCQQSQEDLNDALKELLGYVQMSIRISRNFLYITMGYMVAVAMLLLLELSWMILIPSLAVVSTCYLYKLVEFVRNRYCDRDVRIVLIYKIALFHLLEESCLQKEGHEL
jgi:hypothetical protein